MKSSVSVAVEWKRTDDCASERCMDGVYERRVLVETGTLLGAALIHFCPLLIVRMGEQCEHRRHQVRGADDGRSLPTMTTLQWHECYWPWLGGPSSREVTQPPAKMANGRQKMARSNEECRSRSYVVYKSCSRNRPATQSDEQVS